MTAPLLLLLYAVAVSTLGVRGLQDADWPQRSPRLGVLAWQALTASVLLSVLLAGGAIALPALPLTTNLADFLHGCALALRQHYATPGGAAAASLSALLATLVAGRVAYCLLCSWWMSRRRHAVQLSRLQLVARRLGDSGALVVEHASPAVYCMPGRHSEVVITSAALATLNDRQIEAVLAHERAHVRGRHDLVLMAAAALQQAFPFVRPFAIAREQLARLVEMHADDAAIKCSGRRVLATALVRLAEGVAPVGTIGVGGESALARVRRMAQPGQPLGRAGSILAVTATIVVVALPVLVAIAPAMASTVMHYCPVGFPS